MGTCRYAYNPSESYQRTPPGCGAESHCGAQTWPLVDEPELRLVSAFDEASGAVLDRLVPTGRLVAREQDDPYCPLHGGSPQPPPPDVTMAELEQAHHAYMSLASRFQGQQPGAIAEAVPEPVALAAGASEFNQVIGQADLTALDDISPEQLRAAADHLQQLADQSERKA